MNRRRLVVACAMTIVLLAGLVGVAHAKYRGSDLLGNVLPQSQLPSNSLIDRYPISAYGLDFHIDTGTAGLDVTSWPAVAGQFLVAELFAITAMVMTVMIRVFLWAFSLDLVNGNGRAGSSALEPVTMAMQNLHDGALGHWWIVIGILLAGLWGTYVGLAHRRTSELFAGLARSVVFAVIAMTLLYDPQGTIGAASRAVNQFSQQLLTGASGRRGDPAHAQARIADDLFADRVYRPWQVLEFGGMQTCADWDRKDSDGFPHPVPATDGRADTCRDTHEYAARYLRQPMGSDERKKEYEALKDGEVPSPPDPQFAGWQVSKGDAGAVDAQQEGGTLQRVGMAAVVLTGMWGTIFCLGFLSLAALLVQMLMLALLAVTPIMLVFGMVPGFGHRMFEGWGKALLVAVLLMKPTYAVVLGITLGISSAITLGMSSLGFLMAVIATAAFWWGLIGYRRTLNKHAGGQANARTQQQIERRTEKTRETTTRHAKAAASKVSGSPMMGASTIWAAGRSSFSKDKPAKAAETKPPEHAANGTGPPASSAAQSNGAGASPPSAREPDRWEVSGHATRDYAPPPAAAGATAPDAKPAATKADPAVAPPARTPVSAGRDRSKELRFRPRRRDK
jgi:hypothetical protein